MTDTDATPDTPEDPPLETEGVGEDPGSLPTTEQAVEPVGPADPEPDVNDGQAPQPMHDSTSHEQHKAGHPEHDSVAPAFDDEQDDPDALPRGEPTLNLGDERLD